MVDGQNLSDNSLHGPLGMVRKFSTLKPLQMAFLAGPGPFVASLLSTILSVSPSDRRSCRPNLRINFLSHLPTDASVGVIVWLECFTGPKFYSAATSLSGAGAWQPTSLQYVPLTLRRLELIEEHRNSIENRRRQNRRSKQNRQRSEVFRCRSSSTYSNVNEV